MRPARLGWFLVAAAASAALLAGSTLAGSTALPACTTGAGGTLQPAIADLSINQGLPSYATATGSTAGRLVRGKDTLVRAYLTLPATCSGSITITGASLSVGNGSSTFAIAAQAGSASGSLTTAVQTISAADPTFFVPAADLGPGDGSTTFTGSFTLTVTFTQNRTSTLLSEAFAARTATFEKKTNALRILVVPMGDGTLAFSAQFPAAAQTDVQNGMSTLSRIYPLPAGIGDLRGSSGGVRYTIDLATMLDLRAIAATVPGTYTGSLFCGSQANWDSIKGQLALYRQAWNTQNPAATADKVVGAVHESVSAGGNFGCADGMGSVISSEAWVRAFDDQPSAKPAVVSRTGALLAMEVEHTFGGIPTPRGANFHSINIAADLTAPGKGYNLASKQPLGGTNHSAMRFDTSTSPWDNSDTLLEQQDFADLLCWMTATGATNSECATSGIAGTATGVAAGPQLVGAGTTDGTPGGTTAETYYATDVAPQATCPGSVYRLIQVTAASTVLNNAGVCVSFQGSEHAAGTTAPTSALGVFSFSVDGFLGAGSANIEIVKVGDPGDNPLGGTILYSRDKQAAPTVTTVSYDHAVPFSLRAPTIPPKPDVVFLADTTGSMGGALQNVQTQAANVMSQVLSTQPLAAFGVADYKDFDCTVAGHDPDVPYTLGQAVTTDTATVQSALNAWFTFPGAGCDAPEAQLNALYRLATDANVGWRDGSSRIVAWFGDAPGHDPSGGHTLQDVVGALTAPPGVRVVAVSVNGGGLDSTGQATTIVNATHGVYQQNVTDQQVADAITAGLRNLPVTIGTSSSCDQGTTLALGAQQPANPLPSGADFSFPDATIHVAAGAAPGTYSCTVSFTVNGRPEPALSQTLHAVVPQAPPSSTVGVTATSADPTRLQVDLFYLCGGVYYPVAVGLRPDAVTSTSASFSARFDSTNACGGTAAGNLVAFANDGFLRSAGAEAPPEGGAPGSKGPSAAIYAPTSTIFAVGSALAVFGEGKSPQTGQLPPASLHWALTDGAGQVVGEASGPSGDIVLAPSLPTGDYTLTLTATDAVGTATDSRPVRIVAPPTLTISHSPGGATTTSSPVTFTVAAGSALGLASVACTLDSADLSLPAAGGTSYSTTIAVTGYGLHTVACRATDTAGFATDRTDQVQIVYQFNGFLSPIVNGSTNTGIGGHTYPVKWQLRDSTNAFVTSISVVTGIKYRTVSCSDLSPVSSPITTVVSGASTLRYDSGTNQFVYNWQTPTAPSTRCYRLDVSLNDGTVHTANFKLS